jgi:AcrR family transcriptional regulator
MSDATRGGDVERTAPAVTRRRQIAEKAAELFDAAGYYNTSMEDIAESAGLRKPTLYHYFKSKDEILLEIHSEMIELILRRHEERLEAGVESHSRELYGLMRDLIELMETHPGHLRIFFEHQRELPEHYKEPIRARRQRFRGYVSDAIAGGIEAGEFVETDVEMATLAILGMCNWTYQWLRPNQERTAAEVTDAFWHFAMRGIAVNPPA